MTQSTPNPQILDTSFEDFPCRLVVLLYSEAITALEAAIDAIASGDIAARFKATERTAEVVHELQQALDMDHGGAIAANLDRIYTLVITQLPILNLRNDPQIARTLIGLLNPLREAWTELDERIRHDVAMAENAAAGSIPAPASESRLLAYANR